MYLIPVPLNTQVKVRMLTSQNVVGYFSLLEGIVWSSKLCVKTHFAEHAVELQLLAFTFTKNGFCAALDDLVALSGMGKDAYLTDIKTAINQKTNLYNIPKDTNAAVRTVPIANSNRSNTNTRNSMVCI